MLVKFNNATTTVSKEKREIAINPAAVFSIEKRDEEQKVLILTREEKYWVEDDYDTVIEKLSGNNSPTAPQ